MLFYGIKSPNIRGVFSKRETRSIEREHPNVQIQEFESYTDATRFAEVDPSLIIECNVAYNNTKPQQLEAIVDRLRACIAALDGDIVPPIVVYTDSKYAKMCAEERGYETNKYAQQVDEFRVCLQEIEDVYDELGARDLAVSFVLFGHDEDGDAVLG